MGLDTTSANTVGMIGASQLNHMAPSLPLLVDALVFPFMSYLSK